MLVKDFLKIVLGETQLFDVRNGLISNDTAVWEYNLTLDEVYSIHGERKIHTVFSDMSQDGTELLADYEHGFGVEPEDYELTTISIVLEDDLKNGDHVVINDYCQQPTWVNQTGTLVEVNESTARIKFDKPVPDEPFPPLTDIVLLKYKFNVTH